MIGSVLSLFAALQPMENVTFSYDRCVALVETDAQLARQYAEQWDFVGGGESARHCLALSFLAQGSSLAAGGVLADLADQVSDTDSVGASFYLAQAATAFIEGGRKEAAFAALRHAYALAPDEATLHREAALVYAAAEEWEGVVLALTALSRHAELSADAFVLRGKAHRALGDGRAAAEDVAEALAREPLLVDALVLRGDLLNDGVRVPTRQEFTVELPEE